MVRLTIPEASPAVPPSGPFLLFVTDKPKGHIVVELVEAWAPLGVARVLDLARSGFFTNVRFFRVIKGFMAQFGMSGDVATQRRWAERRIKDDPVVHTNVARTVTFATSGKDSRTCQLFINFGDNSRLDSEGFAPIGRVVEGWETVERLNGEYGEGAPGGKGPAQGKISQQGNAYLDRDFPRLSRIASQWLLDSRLLPSAPDRVRVRLGTTKGDVYVHVFPRWAPIGARRFLALVEDGYYDAAPIFRCIPNFLCQFGLAADPAVTQEWEKRGMLRDDPRTPLGALRGAVPSTETTERGKFKRGWLAFAGWGPNSRATNVFVALRDSGGLGGAPWERPFGVVATDEGMGVVDSWHMGYGDAVSHAKIHDGGAKVVESLYPKLDRFTTCSTELMGDDASAGLDTQSVVATTTRVFPDATAQLFAIAKQDRREEESQKIHVADASRRTVFGQHGVVVLLALLAVMFLAGFFVSRRARAKNIKPLFPFQSKRHTV